MQAAADNVAGGPVPPASFRFVLELRRQDGALLRRLPIEPDWEPAVESTRFEAIRRGRLPAVTTTGPGVIEPVWDGRRGAPYVAAFRVTLPGGAPPPTGAIPITYVRALARSASDALITEGILTSGEVFTYGVCAFPGGPRGAPEPDGLGVQTVTEALPLVEASLLDLLADTEPAADADTDLMPVFVAADVVADAVALARRAGDVEVGGVLVGRLCRDASVPEVFVDVTALIPARHTVSSSAQVTFTADTWAAADAALALRRLGEIKVGWFHFHPNWCRRCPPDKRARCALGQPFFSADDVHLHRTCFSRAYHVALLVTETDTGFVPTLYGWERGMVTQRTFHTRCHRGPVAP